MARIPRELVDAVRERTDIAEVIGRHVALVRRGRNLVGLCPFHQEKSPSFNVIPEKGIYHCFGCQAGGDVFRFLMTLEGLSFVEAIKELATAAGITVEERELTPAERKALAQRATLFDVLEAAAGFYEAQLWTGSAGAPAREYLERRGTTTETARMARLGWAPGGWTRLIDAMHREHYDPEQLADAGLAKARDQGGGYYDTLRERVIVPIRDEKGRVIAFGGRILSGDGPKYINTPETRLYQKSHVLYGLDHARQHVQRKGRIVVVEGYFDVLSSWQGGFDETVATCGTALTAEHLEKIRRLTRDVVLVMDADDAGLRAAERSLPLFVAAGIQPWRVNLPGAKDPDELLRVEGPGAFAAALEAREPLFEWVVQRKLDAYGNSSMSRERVLDEVAPMLTRLRDPLLVNQVARRLGLNEEIVKQRVRELPKEGGKAAEADPTPAAPAAWQPHRDVVHLLWLVVHRYDEVADLVARADPRLLDPHPQVRPILARLVSGEPVAAVAQEVADPAVQRTLLAIVARDKLYAQEEAAHALVQVLIRLWRPGHTARLAALAEEIRAATADHDRSMVAFREKMELQDRERRLDAAVRAGKLSDALTLLAPVAA
ncbi:MAG: DNA primase [Myxococcota bacterium]